MKNDGFIILTSVIIIGAVVLLIGMGVALRSMGETDMSSNEEITTRVLSLVNTCAELGVIKLRNNLNYSGNEDIIIEGSDSCRIFPTEGTGNTNRIIKTEAEIKGFKKRIKVDIETMEPLNIRSWQEVAVF